MEIEALINIGFMILQIYAIISLIAFLPAMVSILKEKRKIKYKIVWLAICLILGFIGILAYFLVEKK